MIATPNIRFVMMKNFGLIIIVFFLSACQPRASEVQENTIVIQTPPQPRTTQVSLKKLLEIANRHLTKRKKVHGRVNYPQGWYNGMVITFAKSACRGLNPRDPFYPHMVSSRSTEDSLRRLTPKELQHQQYTQAYNQELESFSARVHPSGMNQLYLPVYDGLNLSTEDKQLEVLYALLLTLGMRESSGGKDNGIDKKSSYYKNCIENTPEQCEAGSLQASQNSTYFVGKELSTSFFESYWATLLKNYEGTCQWNSFNVGVSQREEEPVREGHTLQRTGNPYADFRNLMIGCPMANVEYNAMLLRKTYRHHGPIKRFEAPLYAESIDMFSKIHQLVKKSPQSICKAVVEPLY
jgi:hypothetical protein